MEIVRRTPHIQTVDEVNRIRCLSERIAAQFVLTENPELRVFHEQRRYSISDEERQLHSLTSNTTIPDFEIYNRAKDTYFVLEVTSKIDQASKKQQQGIMKIANPGVPYVVLFGNEIRSMRKFNERRDVVDRKCKNTTDMVTVFDWNATPALQQLQELIQYGDSQDNVVYLAAD